jgi:hypothetical protein
MDHQIEKMGIVQIMSTKKEKKDDGRRAHFGIFLCVCRYSISTFARALKQQQQQQQQLFFLSSNEIKILPIVSDFGENGWAQRLLCQSTPGGGR